MLPAVVMSAGYPHSTEPSPSTSRSALRAILSDPAAALIGLLALAVIGGAGGVNAPFGNLAVQLAAIAVLALHGRSVAAFVSAGPRALVALVIASCLLPLLQIVPLPPAVWQSLPGRDLVAQSLDLAGGRGWFPLSVDRSRTLLAFLGTLAPFAVIAVGCALSPARLIRLQQATIGIGVAVALFGTTHLFDPGWGDLYADQIAMPGVLVATFADRNAAALFLDCCLLLLAGLPALPRTIVARAVAIGSGAFLAICVILTQSRSGIALLGAPAALLAWRTAAHWRQRRESRRHWLAVLAVAGLASAAVISSEQAQTSLARFGQSDAMRAEMREDASFAARRYWPIGAGMGTFDEVFQVDESLEYVSPRRAGRAHMDYLELAIEAGAIGLALVVGWFVWVGWCCWRAVRRPGAWPARAAVLMVAAIAAQSLLSFPLRNQAMLCVAALAAVLLARSPVAAVAGRPR